MNATARRRIQIDPESWHYRLYVWWRITCGNQDLTPRDLCRYARAILLWAPLTALLWSGPNIVFRALRLSRFKRLALWFKRHERTFSRIAGAVVVGLVLLLIAKGFYDNWVVAAIVVASTIVGGVLLIVLSVGIADLLGRRSERRKGRPHNGTSGLRLGWEYARAAKRKVCPLIELDREHRAS